MKPYSFHPSDKIEDVPEDRREYIRRLKMATAEIFDAFQFSLTTQDEPALIINAHIAATANVIMAIAITLNEETRAEFIDGFSEVFSAYAKTIKQGNGALIH